MPRLARSDDPIPVGHIGLSEAFDLYYETVTPNWRELDAAINAATPADFTDRSLILAFNARDEARGAAEIKFRAALTAGELRAMIRDPANGDLLELSRNGWERPSDNAGFAAGFDEDFVEHGDPFQPGPTAVINGYLRPVFFKDEEFNSWIARSAPGRDVHIRGRKPSYGRASIRKWVFDLMDHHGEFYPDDPDWKSQADLERAILDKFALSGKAPAESTVRVLIREPLAEWRAQKAGN
jgi:hypothetical protein